MTARHAAPEGTAAQDSRRFERLERRHRLPVIVNDADGGMTVVRAEAPPLDPGLTPGGRRSRARYLPHSHRLPPRQPNPTTGRMWPPRGWTPEGLAGYRARTDRVRLFLLSFGAGQHGEAYAGRLDVAAARLRELAQFGATPEDAAAALRAATDAVLAVRALSRADTGALTLPRPPLPTDAPRGDDR